MRAVHTPWGVADSVEVAGDGVVFYGTPSHGGYHVTGAALERIPPQFREASCAPGWFGWFEEDVDWAIVAVYFPEYFPPDAQDHARATLERYRPAVLQAVAQ